MRPALLILLFAWPVVAAEFYIKQPTWTDTMQASRAALTAAKLPATEAVAAAGELWTRTQEDFPVNWDWALQDGVDFARWFLADKETTLERQLIERVTAGLRDSGGELQRSLDRLTKDNVPGTDRRWLDLYVKACEQRRQERLRTVMNKASRLVFTKHPTIRPSFFAYTEGQSDAQDERHFVPGSELCLLEMDGLYGKVRTLVADPHGAIRDPAVSWDGQRVLFAWKKSLNDDDYHLYELEVASGKVRQITTGAGFADYEPAYLPNGDIIFASTRCVQTVDCWWTEVSNLYTCDADGRYLRRLGFDQVHAIYPQVLDDGRVVYTRWDYNDRGQIFPQPLFQMHPDGTGQTEYYGNNSWFPTTIAHARGIPGTDKVLAVLCGHHTSQAGKLAVIDPAKGRQENSGVQLVAPRRATPADRIDDYGQIGELWQYPYPITVDECIVTFAPLGWNRPTRRRGDADFGIYWMDLDGRRELLAWDRRWPCSQPVPLAARRRPAEWATHTDYTRTNGTYYVQDVYSGPGLAGVPRGTIKKLRVVALSFRPAGIGHNGSGGPAGGALVSTPISIGNGSWDVKILLGEATVHEDGSALFSVPARTPVYFQALNERGRAVQTMRSWSTLQPGEYSACLGCHEQKNTASTTSYGNVSQAIKAGADSLQPFYGPPRGFSFAKEIQPILDRHCIRCHKDRSPIEALLNDKKQTPVLERTRHESAARSDGADRPAFSLLAATTEDPGAKRQWSDAYLTLTQSRPTQTEYGLRAYFGNCGGRVVNWISSQSVPEMLPPYSAGSTRSELMALLEKGHQGVTLSQEELEKIACWIDLLVPYCGDYLEANAWTDDELKKYEHFTEKRRRMAELEQKNIRELLESQAKSGGSTRE